MERFHNNQSVGVMRAKHNKNAVQWVYSIVVVFHLVVIDGGCSQLINILLSVNYVDLLVGHV